MNRKQLIKLYINFFKSKGHKEIPNAPLIPKDDPTVLFTTAGMHPLVPYLLGQKHPQGKRLVNVQKCIRTGDIEEVGNKTYHTFFEMLGNWSLGDYWKEKAIKDSFDFLTKKLKIPKEKISITCFRGESNIPKDTESAKIWKDLGIKKIKFLGKEDNWWGPAGETGPCGPDTEMFVDDVEIWNDVFMEYMCKQREWVEDPIKGRISDNMKLADAEQKNVDTGMGVERTLAILQGHKDNYLTEIWKPLINEIEHIHHIKYSGKNKRIVRIIADHVKAAYFIAAEGIVPSNKEHGYILRKLIRRAHILINKTGGKGDLVAPLLDKVMHIYPDYKHLKEKYKETYKVISEEENKFEDTLDKGLRVFEKLTKNKKQLSGKDSFLLFQSYGFPLEIIKDLCRDKKIKFKEEDFKIELIRHQALSRTASKGKFKSGLVDHSETTTKLHTATHLLLAALRKVLKSDITQKGSNITPERLRLDFSFPRKLTQEEIKKIETLVNQQIKKNLKIKRQEMSPKQAKKQGAAATFGEKYGTKVSVYSVGNFSKEICAGPHVKNTKELGNFKITKESSSSAGVRRIKATLK